jgi:hypothetical protein
MESKLLASFSIQTSFADRLREKLVNLRFMITIPLWLALIGGVAFAFPDLFLVMVFMSSVFGWLFFTALFTAILGENNTNDLYLPFTLDFYTDKMVFNEKYQLRNEPNFWDKWKIYYLTRNIPKKERQIEYFYAHTRKFELIYTNKGVLMVIFEIGNTTQKFNIIKNPNTVEQIQAVLQELYEMKIKVAERNERREELSFPAITESEKVDENLLQLINELGKHEQGKE